MWWDLINTLERDGRLQIHHINFIKKNVKTPRDVRRLKFLFGKNRAQYYLVLSEVDIDHPDVHFANALKKVINHASSGSIGKYTIDLLENTNHPDGHKLAVLGKASRSYLRELLTTSFNTSILGKGPNFMGLFNVYVYSAPEQIGKGEAKSIYRSLTFLVPAFYNGNDTNELVKRAKAESKKSNRPLESNIKKLVLSALRAKESKIPGVKNPSHIPAVISYIIRLGRKRITPLLLRGLPLYNIKFTYYPDIGDKLVYLPKQKFELSGYGRVTFRLAKSGEKHLHALAIPHSCLNPFGKYASLVPGIVGGPSAVFYTEDQHKNVLGRVIFNLFEYDGSPVFIPNNGYGPLGEFTKQQAIKVLRFKNIPVIVYDEKKGWQLLQGTKTKEVDLSVKMGSYGIRIPLYPKPARSAYKEKTFYYDHGFPEVKKDIVKLKHVLHYR